MALQVCAAGLCFERLSSIGPMPIQSGVRGGAVSYGDQAMHILIADDDNVSRVLLGRILKQVPGYRVNDADSGEKAWELMDKGMVPDLFMLDLHLPGIDGLELLKKIRADDRLKHLPVIICTAVGTRETVLEAASLDVAGYLLKPLSAAKVFEQVRKSTQRTKVREPLEDELRVRNRLGIDAQSYSEMLGMLIHEVGQGVGDIRVACEQSDFQGARLKISALKGGCRNLGASGLVSILTNLENKLTTDESAPVLSMLEQLKAEHAHLEEIVQERGFGSSDSKEAAKSTETADNSSTGENEPEPESESGAEPESESEVQSEGPSEEAIKAGDDDKADQQEAVPV